MVLPKEAQRSSQAPIAPETGQDCSSALRDSGLCRVGHHCNEFRRRGIQGTAGQAGWTGLCQVQPQALPLGRRLRSWFLSPFARLWASLDLLGLSFHVCPGGAACGWLDGCWDRHELGCPRLSVQGVRSGQGRQAGQAAAGNIEPFKAVKDSGTYGFQHVLGAGNTPGNRPASLHC